MVSHGPVGRILREAADTLQGATEAPQLEAELLLAHVTGLSRTTILTHPELDVPEGSLSNYQAVLRHRASGYPLPYLTGDVEFYGLPFAVTPDVLIPRPETETLVNLALSQQPETVLDIGTGSGCLAVTLAVHLPQSRVYATDLSAPALQIAAANARRHGVEDRVLFVHCDLADPMVGPVDLVVSNPPYVARAEWASLPDSVRQHEPSLALDGGPDGLKVIRRLLAAVSGLLGPGGVLLMEIGASQGKMVTTLARSFWPQSKVAIHLDLARRDRVLQVLL